MRNATLLLMAVIGLGILAHSCKKDEEKTPQVTTVKIGAQENGQTGGFYSVSENRVYTMEAAAQTPQFIDILCFYEAENGNNIALASPGSGITGIFTGPSAVDTWTVKDTTYFCTTTLTSAQFDAIAETDDLIISSFDESNQRKKAKDMQVDDIYAFRVQSGDYGLLKVTAVTQGTAGDITFEVKMKK